MSLDRRLKTLETLVPINPEGIRERYYRILKVAEARIYARAARSIIGVIGEYAWLLLRSTCEEREMHYISDSLDAMRYVLEDYSALEQARDEALFTRWVAYVGRTTVQIDVEWRLTRLTSVADGLGIDLHKDRELGQLLRDMLSIFTDCDTWPKHGIYSASLGNLVQTEFCTGELAFYREF